MNAYPQSESRATGHASADVCRKSPTKHHEPDWASAQVTHDGGMAYVDVNCAHCGRSGCVGTSETLADNVDW